MLRPPYPSHARPPYGEFKGVEPIGIPEAHSTRLAPARGGRSAKALEVLSLTVQVGVKRAMIRRGPKTADDRNSLDFVPNGGAAS